MVVPSPPNRQCHMDQVFLKKAASVAAVATVSPMFRPPGTVFSRNLDEPEGSSQAFRPLTPPMGLVPAPFVRCVVM